jgi:hypothetical protein
VTSIVAKIQPYLRSSCVIAEGEERESGEGVVAEEGRIQGGEDPRHQREGAVRVQSRVRSG